MPGPTRRGCARWSGGPALQGQIDELRNSMTQGTEGDASLAAPRARLIMAEAEVQTREMMRAQAMQQVETARMEVSRQVRYLALTVEPIASDEAGLPAQTGEFLAGFPAFCRDLSVRVDDRIGAARAGRRANTPGRAGQTACPAAQPDDHAH